MNCGIYKITCKETGRCYIGQSKHIEARWKGHQKKRFLIDAFDYEILVTCQAKDLNDLEILMIETFDSHRNGYNKTIGGTSIKTIHPDEETRRKMSEAKKGKPPHNKGKSISVEQKAKLSEALKGKPLSEETRAKMSEAQKGKTLSEEHRQKMSEAKKGKSPHNKGKPMSVEQKTKLSETLKAYWARKSVK